MRARGRMRWSAPGVRNWRRSSRGVAPTCTTRGLVTTVDGSQRARERQHMKARDTDAPATTVSGEPPAGPATPATVKARGLLPSLSPAEQRVARVVIDEAATAAKLTITELAERAGTSETTVIRFCRAIAFADARAVEDTGAQLDVGVLERVVDAVVAARRVDIYGVGASSCVGYDFQQKLHRIGRVAFAWSDMHLALTSAALLGETDVAFGISHTGTTIDTIEAFAEAGRRGALTVALTNFPKSPITGVADLVLTTAARETTFRSGAMASRLAQLTVVDCIFVGVAQRTYAQTRAALEATYEAVRSRRRRPERGRW